MSNQNLRKICHFFQKGTCRNGLKCPGAHVEAGLAYSKNYMNASAAASASEEPEVCRYFLKGMCNKGTECKFLHPATQKSWNPDDLEEADDDSDDGAEIDDIDDVDDVDAIEYDLLSDETKDRIFMLARTNLQIENPDQYEWKIIVRGGWRNLLDILEDYDAANATGKW